MLKLTDEGAKYHNLCFTNVTTNVCWVDGEPIKGDCLEGKVLGSRTCIKHALEFGLVTVE